MKLLKKILLILVLFTAIFTAVSAKVNAESTNPIYLGIETFRSSGYGYIQGGKKVWKIAQYETLTGGVSDKSQMIYSIKAGAGFGLSGMATDGETKRITYNQKFNLKDLNSINSPYLDVLPTGENYNKLMWILDNMYIIPEDGNETTKNDFLKSLIPEENYSLLTNDDIDVVQQLAIWYFTNLTGDYHFEDLELYINASQSTDANYKTLEELYGEYGKSRQNAATALYKYYIDNADGSYNSSNATTNPIELDQSRDTIELSGNNLIAGPYRINELLDIDYNLDVTYTNQNSMIITPSIGVKDESGNIVTTTASLEELMGTDFYLIVPANSDTTGINMTINTTYTNREAEYLSVANAPETEQPVVIVKNNDYYFTNKANISVNQGEYTLNLLKIDEKTKQNLSGARFSVSINGGEVENYTTDENGSILIDSIATTGIGKDIITVQEIEAPTGYNSIIGTLTIEVEKTIVEGKYTAVSANFSNSTNPDGSTIKFNDNTISLTVPNEKITGSYGFRLTKVDAYTQEPLEGVEFSVKFNDEEAKNYTTDSEGLITINDIEITEPGTDIITVEEITALTGYNPLAEPLVIEVKKIQSAGKYVTSGVKFVDDSQESISTLVCLNKGVIALTIPNKKPEGSYNLQIVKKDSQNIDRLEGAKFTVKINNEEEQEYTTDENGVIRIDNIKIEQPGTDQIIITETEAPEGYNKLINSLNINVETIEQDGNYIANNIEVENEEENGTLVTLNDGNITATIPNERIKGTYNLHLVKVDSEDDSINLKGAKFTVQINNGKEQEYTTDEDGNITIDNIAITEEGTDAITIKEIQAPEGYNIQEIPVINVTKTVEDGKYIASNIEFANGADSNGVIVELDEGTITATIPDKKITGTYNLQLIKVDSKDNSKTLEGAKFEVQINSDAKEEYTTDENGNITIEDIEITEIGTDTITINETQEPEGYNMLVNTLTIDVSKIISEGKYIPGEATFSRQTNANGSTIRIENNTVIVTIPNEKITGTYKLQLIKQDEETNENLEGATFNVAVNNNGLGDFTTERDGIVEVEEITIDRPGTDTITVIETEAPTGYNKIIDTLNLNVETEEQDGKYVATNVEFTPGTQTDGSTVELQGDVIKLTVPNEKITGSYDLQLIKQDAETDDYLEGAKFSVQINNGEKQEYTTDGNGNITIEDIEITEEGTDIVKLEELQAPEQYKKIEDTIIFNITKIINQGKYMAVPGGFSGQIDTSDYSMSASGDTVTVTIPNEKIKSSYKLQLVKEDSLNNEVLQGATFSVKLNENDLGDFETRAEGKVETEEIKMDQAGIDTITIEETKAPEGYNKLINSLSINVEKEEVNGAYIIRNVQFAPETEINGSTIEIQDDVIIVTIPNEKMTGSYNIQLIKKDKDTDVNLEGAVFSISINNGEVQEYTTDSNGLITINNVEITEEGTDVITVEEITAPKGYCELTAPITLRATKTISNGMYVLSGIEYEGNSQEIPSGSACIEGDTIKLTVPNKRLEGSYNIQLIKEDGTNNNKLAGAVFNLKINDGEDLVYTTNDQGVISIDGIQMTVDGTDVITIEEITPPVGYNSIIGTLTLNVTKTVSNNTLVVNDAKFADEVNTNGSTVVLNEDTIVVTIPNEKITSTYNLQLIKVDNINNNKLAGAKFSVKINNDEPVEYTTNQDGVITINVTMSDIGTDKITIEEIEAPTGYNSLVGTLVLDVTKIFSDNTYTVSDVKFNDQTDSKGSTVSVQDDVITLTVPNELKTGSYNLQLLKVDSQNSNKLLSGAVFSVKVNNEEAKSYTTNENGEITISGIEITQEGTDVITIEETTPPAGYNKIIGTIKLNVEKTAGNNGYIASNAEFTEDTTQESLNGSTINLNNNVITVTIPNSYFDLSLRKFITGVNNEQITNREPQVDVTPLVNGSSTTAIYNHTKEPVKAVIGSVVEYTIRVYNEGQIDGYASQIKDHIPEQLEFLPENATNQEYRWVMLDSEGNQTDNVEEATTIATDYLSREQEEGTNLITAFDGQNLSYKDVKVAFKVKETDQMPETIINIADIADFTDEDGNDVEDRDSEEDNVKIPEDENIPAQEDDEDYEKIDIAEFDLSLRKFLTAVNSTEITNRIPQVDVSGLLNESSTTAIYNHSKDPVLVSNSSIVTYTIRVYNEGEVAGYASRIKDDIPEGLEFLPDNEINQEYGWIMIDSEENETENVEEATAIETRYLSKEQEQEEGANLIAAFDGENLDYKDVQIAFRVTEPGTQDRIITNIAQITEDADEQGNEIKDRDSNTEESNETEDDIDTEKVKVQYFDLSLRKWVTQAIVTRNGEQTITETGNKAEDESKDIVAVDIKDSQIQSTTVKFKYSIRVTNEGTIAGYAREIKDYIPNGLTFIQEDNEGWTQLDENTIVTTQVQDILLEPGESVDVEVILTWDKAKQNFGLMENWAEISKDYNDFNTPDIDSVTDNRVESEDDIDNAPVLVSLKTGEVQIYVIITLSVLGILGTGFMLIKKFVL